ncbi:hypothetical protein GBAR_LOCUS29944 [Geodia barretti]|uniref:Uncharacterized protein n=1 Tax=Geodia barretti TaxID=519541 RepID=A0AA35TUV9_GEOBA|nr:hypothetical protein GBAR_LOCUS29944 [Geodia barretti]
MAFISIGDKLWAEDGLKAQLDRQGSLTVIGPEEHLVYYPEVGYPMRSVNDGEQYISRKVAFAHYEDVATASSSNTTTGSGLPSRCPSWRWWLS